MYIYHLKKHFFKRLELFKSNNIFIYKVYKKKHKNGFLPEMTTQFTQTMTAKYTAITGLYLFTNTVISLHHSRNISWEKTL